jgi:hypothetical protein
MRPSLHEKQKNFLKRLIFWGALCYNEIKVKCKSKGRRFHMNKIVQAIEKQRALILDAERQIWKTPETGYKEYKTSAYLAQQFHAMGYELTMAGNIPGFYTVVDTGREGPDSRPQETISISWTRSRPRATASPTPRAARQLAFEPLRCGEPQELKIQS